MKYFILPLLLLWLIPLALSHATFPGFVLQIKITGMGSYVIAKDDDGSIKFEAATNGTNVGLLVFGRKINKLTEQ